MRKPTEEDFEQAKAAFRKLLPSDWITRDKDLHQMEVEIVEAERQTGRAFMVHLEVVRKAHRHRGGISSEMRTDKVKEYDACSIPVLILHWTKATKQFHCLFAQRFIQKELPVNASDWSARASVKLDFQPDSELKDMVSLASILTNAFFYLLDRSLGMRPETFSPQYWLGDTPVSSDEELKNRTIKALSHLRDSDCREAADELDRMLRGCVMSPVEKVSLVLNLGNALFSMSSYAEARRNYAGALELTEKIGEGTREGRSAALANLGIVCFEMGATEDALAYLQDAMTIQRDMELKHRELRSLACIAMVYRARSDLDKALKFCQHASRVARECNCRQAEADQMCNLGLIQSDKGEWEPALQSLREAQTIDKEIGYRDGYAYHLSCAGLVHRAAGDRESAQNCLREALETAEGIGDRQGQMIYVGAMGLIHREKGELDKALECFERELKLSREIGYRRGEVSSLSNMGFIHDAKGELNESLELFQEALKIAREIGYKEGEANQLGNIGLAYFDKGDLDRSLECLKTALIIHRDVGYRQGEASGLGNIGLVYEAKGETDSALKYLEEALGVLAEYDLKHGKEIIENAIRELQQQKDDMG